MSTLAVGVATYTRHDAHTRKIIADFKVRLDDATDAAVLEAAARLDRPAARQHPLAPKFREIVDAELAERGLSLASLAGGAR